MKKVLIIADDFSFLEILRTQLKRVNYEVTAINKAQSALTLLRAGEAYDAITTDLRMTKMDGEAFLIELQEMDIQVPVLVITGAFLTVTREKFIKQLCNQFIYKPYRISELELTLNSLWEVK